MTVTAPECSFFYIYNHQYLHSADAEYAITICELDSWDTTMELNTCKYILTQVLTYTYICIFPAFPAGKKYT